MRGIDTLGDEAMVNADEALAETVEELSTQDEVFISSLVSTITSRYEEAQRSRDSDERRWLQAYQNFRGLYAKNIKFRESEKSRVFVKATKTKVLAAYGQLLDVLFGSNKFPLSISSTDVPTGASEYAHFKVEGNAETGATASDSMQKEFNAADVDWTSAARNHTVGQSVEEFMNGIRKEFHEDTTPDQWAQGPARAGEPQFKPAAEAAKRMERLIHDQLESSNGSTEFRNSLFECALLGTGIIKGPFTVEQPVHKWDVDPNTGSRVYAPDTVKVPKIESCSIFSAFPDPNAATMDECEWFIERHKMSRSQLRSLKNRPFFRKDAINECLNLAPNYTNEDYETQILAENTESYPEQDRYEVLEYWGTVDRKDLENAGVQLESDNQLDEVQINAWICYGKVLRVVVNPFTPKRIPYLAFCYERNPYSFFGIGVAENMNDSQQIMNGHMRMAIDNLALAGNVILDVDENNMAPGQDYSLYPGKVFKRQGGQAGTAVNAIKFPNTAPENMQIFDKFRQIADETTGIPSYAHGQTGVMSTTRTASGMSMLMGAASLNIKTVVKNIDDYLLKPLGDAMFQWNMAFYDGELDVVGDLEIKAGGAASLMQNEVRSQRLTAFAQLFSNPAVAPYIKIPQYIKSFVESLELDPDELINDDEAAKVQAAIMGTAGGAQQPMPEQMGNVGDVPPPAMPGDPQFSANTGEEL